METAHIQDDLLQRYFDGDLTREPQVEAEVAAHLADCDECGGRHAALSRLHAMFVVAAEEMADSAALDGLYARIEHGIAADDDAPGETGAAADPADARGGAWRWLAELIGTRSHVWMPVTGAAVAAAAVLLTVFSNPGEVPTPPHATSVEKPSTASSETETAAAVRPVPQSSEVVQVDFGTNAGTVFEIALSDGSSTPVVWINDEEL